MISGRYLPAIAAVLALACVPTVLHTYVGTTAYDERSVTALPHRLNGMDARPSPRGLAWAVDAYDATDVVERLYGPGLKLFAARSYDTKRLYHHPENAVAHGDIYDRVVVRRAAGRPEVPIFVLHGQDGYASVYTLLYGDDFVEDPIRFQVRNAVALLVRPRRLMTLFFVRSNREPDRGATDVSPAEALLLAAVDSFLTQGRTASP